MIGPLTLVRGLEARGVSLRASGPQPTGYIELSGTVTQYEMELLKKYRHEIMRVLQERKAVDSFNAMINTVVHGDSKDVLGLIPDDAVDAVVCDPPYGIGFMNEKWDRGLPPLAIWQQSLRLLKPGGFAFVMCSPRQDSLMGMISLLEKAGFEIGFTSLYWTYATGFPKINDISKAIDKRAGAVREIVGEKKGKIDFSKCGAADHSFCQKVWGCQEYTTLPITIPATAEAKKFAGAHGGFQPKPAVEVIIVAMKPRREKSSLDQAMANSKGITWHDDCRVPYQEGESAPTRDYRTQKSSASGQVPASKGEGFTGDNRGRMPANLLVSDDVLDAGDGAIYGFSRYFSLDRWFDEKLGQLPEGVLASCPFLIVPKAGKIEKDKGLEEFDQRPVKDGRQAPMDNPFQRGETPKLNTHPCIKPIKLMAYLITMVSRPGDLILDSFVGSGSSCIAAKMLGRRFIGIDREEEYCRIARARLAAVQNPGEGEHNARENTNSGDGKEIRLKKKKSDGAYDWAGRTINCCRGCTNNCRYCYARQLALQRRQVANYEDWTTCHIRRHDVVKRHPNYGELVMFPSTHDITPENLEACLAVLRSLLHAGNRVLIVSKPRLAVIRILCAELGEFRDNILFRLTITATDNAILSFWEPGAASYEERCEALAYAKAAGYETSVSVEPMLDADNISDLIADLQPLVTETIWIGTMNHLKQIRIDSPEIELELARIRGGQTAERLKTIYNSHRENHVIRWKKEIRKVIGIEPPEEPAPTSEGEVQNDI